MDGRKRSASGSVRRLDLGALSAYEGLSTCYLCGPAKSEALFEVEEDGYA